MTEEAISPMMLAASLDIVAAEPLCRSLQAKLLLAEPIVLDGSEVQRIGTPCVQILVAASKSARARGIPFALQAPSQELAEALSDLGLDQAFVVTET